MRRETINTGNERERGIVKQLSGVSDESRIEVSETGWTSRVYIVDNGRIVFKFPRNEEFRDECVKEVAVLEVLKRHHFNISLPALNWTTPDNAYFGFYGVEGKPLKEVIHTLDDTEKKDIGTQLGRFLRQLHHITDYGKISALTLEEQTAEYTKMYQTDRGLLETFFDEGELRAIDDFFSYEVPTCMVGTGELVFCHGDLDYNNTLIDDDNKVGVIDFGDAGLYDRSQDGECMITGYYCTNILSEQAKELIEFYRQVLEIPFIKTDVDNANGVYLGFIEN